MYISWQTLITNKDLVSLKAYNNTDSDYYRGIIFMNTMSKKIPDEIETFPENPPWTLFFDGPLYQEYDKFMKTKDFSKILLNTKLRLASNTQRPEAVNPAYTLDDDHWHKEQKVNGVGDTYQYVSEDYYQTDKEDKRRRARRTRAFIILGFIIMAALAFGTALVIHFIFITPLEERNPNNSINVSFSGNTTTSIHADFAQTTPLDTDVHKDKEILSLDDLLKSSQHDNHDHVRNHGHTLHPDGKTSDNHVTTTAETSVTWTSTTEASTTKTSVRESFTTEASTKVTSDILPTTDALDLEGKLKTVEGHSSLVSDQISETDTPTSFTAGNIRTATYSISRNPNSKAVLLTQTTPLVPVLQKATEPDVIDMLDPITSTKVPNLTTKIPESKLQPDSALDKTTSLYITTAKVTNSPDSTIVTRKVKTYPKTTAVYLKSTSTLLEYSSSPNTSLLTTLETVDETATLYSNTTKSLPKTSSMVSEIDHSFSYTTKTLPNTTNLNSETTSKLRNATTTSLPDITTTPLPDEYTSVSQTTQKSAVKPKGLAKLRSTPFQALTTTSVLSDYKTTRWTANLSKTTTEFPEITTTFTEIITAVPDKPTAFSETTTTIIEATTTIPETTTLFPKTTVKFIEIQTTIPETTTTFPETVVPFTENPTAFPKTNTTFPETTTIFSVTTRIVPETTTTYPETTTTFPETTTTYPETTTTYPETNTTYPKTTTTFPETTTTYPETTQTFPKTTTTFPETTTAFSETTTTYPETTKTLPEPTTTFPETTTTFPKTTTTFPETTTTYPETTKTLSETTTTFPETTKTLPETTTTFPETTTTFPETTKTLPETTTTMPETTTTLQETITTFPETTTHLLETTTTLLETTTTLPEITTLPENYNTVEMSDITSYTFDKAILLCNVRHAVKWKSLSVKVNQAWRPLEVTLFPSGVIKWSRAKKNRHDVMFDISNSTDGTGSNMTLSLIINDVQCRDANDYSCSLKSSIENRTARSRLIVVGKPSKKISLTLGPSVIEDRAFRITASWQGGYPIPWANMSWTALDANNKSYNLADYGEYRDYELHVDHKFCQTTLKHSIVVFPRIHLNDTTVIVKPNIETKRYFVDKSMEKYLTQVQPGKDKILVIPLNYCKNEGKEMSIPHPYTPCRKFVRCLPGDMVIQLCPRGTCFYEGKQECG